MHTMRMHTMMRARAALRPLALMAALALPVACSTDEILQADRPDFIDPGNLAGSLQGAAALYAGAVGDMTVAVDGGNAGAANNSGNGQVMAVGFFTDEFRFGGTPPELREMDLRNVREQNGAWLQTYIDLHRARESAERAATALQAAAPDDERRGTMLSFSGALHILLAENYCSGAPISTTSPTLTYGPASTTEETLQAAVVKLDAALAAAGSNADIRNLAAVLKGRALLDLGQFAAAAQAVAAVPTAFVYNLSHGAATPRQQSFTFTYMYNSQAFLVSDREGTNGLNFATAGDPRVPIEGDGGPSAFDQRTPRYFFKKYNSFGHQVVLASGVEARLIEAEAALQAGNDALWLQKLNEARSPYGMGALTDPGAQAARVDLTFRERAFALFATSHRLGDLRRLVRQYNRPAESVFPTGAYHKDNLTRGTDVNIVVPISEKNNPNFTGCLNRGA